MSVKVWVLDSGVNLEHPMLKNAHIQSFDFSDHRLRSCENNDDYGHGTAISSIIGKKEFAEIYSVKLNNNEPLEDEKLLIEILHYIYLYEDADIINMSLGLNICENKSELQGICMKLHEKGTIIVSAFDNLGSISYPAAFECVIGVISGARCQKISQFEYIDNSVINIAAKGSIQRVAWNNPRYLILGGNSFACAHVTAQIVDFMNDGIRNFDDILQEFRKMAVVTWTNLNSSNDRRKKEKITIQKAILFPFNKEMHSLVRFSHLLSFDIVGIYDVRLSAHVGTGTSHLMGDDVLDICIQNIEDIDWTQFDTIILGHTEELSIMVGRQVILDLLSKAQKYGKQVYSFEPPPIEWLNQDFISFPVVERSDLPSNLFGNLYRISKPVLGVFGTSSKQGKFTLQLKLRELLMKDGYKVGQIGTEPNSLLFGFDEVFPIGYHSTVNISGDEIILYLNDKINRLCDISDLIIVGSQSGTIPYDTGNLLQYATNQYLFLQGTQPDGVVLCVNPFDEEEYVWRTICFIESAIGCKVIALVLFPVALDDDWRGIYGGKRKCTENESFDLAKSFSQIYKRSVYILGNCRDMEDLKNEVVQFFSEK